MCNNKLESRVRDFVETAGLLSIEQIWLVQAKGIFDTKITKKIITLFLVDLDVCPAPDGLRIITQHSTVISAMVALQA